MSKIKTIGYQCKKCNKNVYFQTNMKYETICKTCKSEMQLFGEWDYRPSNGLSAIKNSDIKNKINPKFQTTDSTIVECPYCHSTNTQKITNMSKAVHTALFGIFSVSRNSKNFHCNSCGSDF